MASSAAGVAASVALLLALWDLCCVMAARGSAMSMWVRGGGTPDTPKGMRSSIPHDDPLLLLLLLTDVFSVTTTVVVVDEVPPTETVVTFSNMYWSLSSLGKFLAPSGSNSGFWYSLHLTQMTPRCKTLITASEVGYF